MFEPCGPAQTDATLVSLKCVTGSLESLQGMLDLQNYTDELETELSPQKSQAAKPVLSKINQYYYHFIVRYCNYLIGINHYIVPTDSSV